MKKSRCVLWAGKYGIYACPLTYKVTCLLSETVLSHMQVPLCTSCNNQQPLLHTSWSMIEVYELVPLWAAWWRNKPILILSVAIRCFNSVDTWTLKQVYHVKAQSTITWWQGWRGYSYDYFTHFLRPFCHHFLNTNFKRTYAF